jgi:hypothetical protein
MRNPFLLVLGLALLPGCEERERFILPPEELPDTMGPATVIDIPGQDTTITASDERFIVGGRIVDPSGVDQAIIEITGLDFGFPPIDGDGEDTVRFGIPIDNAGLAGRTVVIRVFAVDVLGNPGDAAVRQISFD